MEMHTKRSLWGYKGDEKSPFIKITFVDQRSMTRVRDKCTLLNFSLADKPYDVSKEVKFTSESSSMMLFRLTSLTFPMISAS